MDKISLANTEDGKWHPKTENTDINFIAAVSGRWKMPSKP